MMGQAAVASLRQRLDATFDRASQTSSDAEVLSDLARYLCVLVSGFLEQAVVELVLEHVRRRSSPTVLRHVESQLRRRFTNAKCQRLIELLGTFDPELRTQLEGVLVDEYRDAVDGIVDLRNRIAHGQGSVPLTMDRVREYYERIKSVVEAIERLCLL